MADHYRRLVESAITYAPPCRGTEEHIVTGHLGFFDLCCWRDFVQLEVGVQQAKQAAIVLLLSLFDSLGAVPGPGQLVGMGHHRAQPGQVERRKVAGAGRLAPVRVGATVAEAGQAAVRGPNRQAGQQWQQGVVVPLRFAEGQVGQYSGQQGHGTPPGMAWRRYQHHNRSRVPFSGRRPPPQASAQAKMW